MNLSNDNLNFRSPRDEFDEVENRWRLLASREAHLSHREREVRRKEEEIRRFLSNHNNMNNNLNNSMITMPLPVQMRTTQQHRQNSFKKKKIKTTDKDYARLAVKTDGESA